MLTLRGDGSYGFPTRVTGAYVVTVEQQPGQAICTVSNGAGTATSDVSNVAVTCVRTYAIGGTVTGLPVGEVVTLANGAETLPVTADGPFGFLTQTLGAYAVTVSMQPSGALCTVQDGAGTAGMDVTNVAVTCVPSFSVGGTLSGLPSGGTLGLTNGSEVLTLSADGAFTFARRTAGAYAVTVSTQPASASCTVQNGAGTATANVTNVAITCVPGFTIGGTVSGLPGSQSVVLANNAGNLLTVMANGPFAFTQVATAYAVTVQTQPAGATCTVSQGTGTASANVSTVAVTCVASGTLDTTYGGGSGFVRYAPTAFHNEWYRAVANPDDSVVWVGSNQVGADEDWVISKLLPDGALDSAFGTAGHLYLNRGASIGERARAIAIGAGGNYYVGGSIFLAGFDFAVARITPAGALDTSYGAGGWAVANFGAAETAQDMVLLPDGSAVVAGYTGSGTSAQILLARFTPAGALDTTFGVSGFAQVGAAGVDDEATAIAADGAGNLYVVGFSGNDSTILKFLPSGTLDVGFGSGGALIEDVSGAAQYDQFNRVAVAPGGAVVALGFASTGTENNATVVRYGSTGTRDSSFGSSGRVVLDTPGQNDSARSLLFTAGGAMLVGGNSSLVCSVWKLTAVGQLDVNFGTAGGYFNQFGSGGGAVANDLVVQSTGKIVFGGSFAVSNPDFGSARLHP